ncbi:MAG: NAD(P)/FAD-dependent oxidoreductase [Thermoguttaceae bacterium]|nr:NAD(P)/FAD-dependent oxidoreductase [Thermoguttaceae bacterium]
MENSVKSSGREERADVLILGAGPAGLMAALGAAGLSASNFDLKKNRKKIFLIEKIPKPGRKLLIAGSGRCNVTHAGPIDDFFTHYGQDVRKARFVKPALMNFTNQNLVAFLASRGLPCVELNDGKIFPRSENSRDVLRVLLEACEDAGVRILCGEEVTALSRNGETSIFEAKTRSGRAFQAEKLVCAVGGKSFPATGSTGDGQILARLFNLPFVELRPALTPVTVKAYAFASCAGIALPEMLVTLWRSGKKLAERRGDVLFTHHGLSGPGILDFSRDFLPGDELHLTLAEGLEDARLNELFQENPQKEVGNLIRTEFWLPDRFVTELLRTAGLSTEMKAWEVTKKTRKTLLKLLKDFALVIQNLGGFREAMVTAGGIALEQVNRQTMESRLVPGLYFAGEVLDVDGDTGGFNLQFAFSSGLLAGQSVGAIQTGASQTGA